MAKAKSPQSAKSRQSTQSQTSGQKSSSKKSASRKKQPPAERPRSAAAIRYQEQEERRLKRNNQFFAIVLFAVGLFFCAVSFFDGPRLWGFLHSLQRGLCGPMSYGIGPLLIYIAVMVTLEKEHTEVHNRVWQMIGMLILLCGIAQLFFGEPTGESFFIKVKNLYTDGVQLKSGGLLAGVLCWPLMSLMGRKGAIIIHVLLTFVFLMLLSGSTLLGFFRGCAKPVKQMEQTYVRKREQREQREQQEEQRRTGRFDLDIPLDGEGREMPQHPVVSPAESFDSAVDRFRESPDALAQRRRKKKKEPEPALPVDPATGEVLQPVAESDPLAGLVEVVPDELLQKETDPEGLPFDPDPAPAAQSAASPAAAVTDDAAAVIDEILAAEAEKKLPGDVQNPDEPLGDMIQWAIDEFKKEPARDPLPPVPEERPAAAAPAAAVSAGIPVPEIEVMPAEQVYRFPPVSLLKPPRASNNADVSEELKANAAKLVETLKSFGVQTKIIDICRGPTVTRYELQPSAGVKISKITGLADDIALNLATAGVRIEAPIPNKPAVGIEVPNRVVDMVSIRELIDSDEFRTAKGVLPAVFGRDIAGAITIGDIAAMPHVLIAGTTGSGKSVCVNSVIISLLYKFSPKDLRLIMIDPKMVELVVYNGIPHLLIPVVTDPRKAAGALGWAVNEMLKRYNLFSENGVRDIKGYNRLAESSDQLEHMPHMVIVIDELSDLMMAAPNEVEDAICRLAQMARAAGMYLIIATQRPSVDVVTGLIKANIPSRIALTVSSQVDSRTIIDTGGAEKLLGKGDMLYYPVGFPKPVRVQGCFVSDGEVEAVVKYIKDGQQQEVEYDSAIMEEIERQAAAEPGKKGDKGAASDDDSDPLFVDAVDAVLDAGQASTSYLQRRLKVGYARAARIMDELEDRGIVGPQDGSKPRELTVTRAQWQEIKERMAEY
ncbi:MAG: DNA translocase FtsK [Oscillospiraceae bacterium]|nr:DNA translocase FtsK [Oscillospiraceae bacterium]